MFKRVSRLIDHFTDTIKAGYYAPAKLDDNPDTDPLPRKPWVLTALGIFSVGYAFATNTVIGLAIEASLVGVTAGIGLAAVATAGLLGAVYLKSKKSGKDRIFETNMAGQRVKGKREDLYQLNKAQRKIISLTEAFKTAAAPKVINAEVQAVVAAHEEICKRVHVVDVGDAPGGEKTYEFVRPVVEFMSAAATPEEEEEAKAEAKAKAEARAEAKEAKAEAKAKEEEAQKKADSKPASKSASKPRAKPKSKPRPAAKAA